MFISTQWINRLLSAYQGEGKTVELTPEELDQSFVRVGFETEGYAALPEITGPLVIGRVLEVEELEGFKKPIRLCRVDVGEANGTGQPQQIICGARNFVAGDYVVVALPGCVLPGSFEISARKTYGHTSAGMMCSAMELGLTPKQNPGIIVIDESSGTPGTCAIEALGLRDTVFEVNITPDRGYALSARGLTREVASARSLRFVDPVTEPSVAGVTVSTPEGAGELLEVRLDDDTLVRRFSLRGVVGIDPGARTPWWMQRELFLCGQRPVNLPTDVTNFVMLLFGLPMHAFDAKRIDGHLHVRCAKPGEKLETLDHVVRTLDPEDVVICDANGPQSMAGVMGGNTSEIADDTTEVYLEAAVWDPIRIARTSRRHKLSSEASRRYERGVDPKVVDVALDTAASLLAQLGGGVINRKVTRAVREEWQPVTIEMAADFPSRYAGVEYSLDTVIARLEETGCAVETEEACAGNASQLLRVTPPSWRPDLTMSVDLVEEILRLEGLESIPSIVPAAPAGRGLTPRQRRRRVIGHALAYSGYTEILPSPFTETAVFDTWGLPAEDPRRAVIEVANPLEADHSVLGTTLLPSMLESLRRNVSRGCSDAALFGIEQVAFRRGSGISPMPSTATRPSDTELDELRESLPHQPLHVATVATGNWVITGPWGEGRSYTFADAIESARVVADAAGVALTLRNCEQLPWHPGRCAELSVGGQVVGYAGELHPQVCAAMDLPQRTCAMELDVTALPLTEDYPAPVLSAYPALLQDVALVVDESVPAESVRAVLEDNAGELIESVTLFDIYRSESLGEAKKSLTFALRFRAKDRTLTDEECNNARLEAIAAVERQVGAQLRA